jgi:transglutaminase-like putative cysteine protease
MQRTVSAHMELLLSGRTDMVFSFTAAQPARATESLTFELDGVPVEPRELVDGHGSRLHRLETDAGSLTVDYSAVIDGSSPPAPVEELDLITYLRPSRYCESDALLPTARSEFAGLSGHALLAGVSTWVWEKLAYVSGSSLPTDGATRTLMSRQGVCRDYAHLTIALLRALDVPARMVAVYAPGLSPMDFHAVTEAYVDGAWWVVDSTRLAPRQSLLRISTGRDAADTAFLSNHWADLQLSRLEVLAIVDELPFDDVSRPVQLS